MTHQYNLSHYKNGQFDGAFCSGIEMGLHALQFRLLALHDDPFPTHSNYTLKRFPFLQDFLPIQSLNWSKFDTGNSELSTAFVVTRQ